MKIFIFLISCIVFHGCIATSADRERILNENLNLFVKEVDAWYDMMPVIEPGKENFRFLVDVNINKLENSYIILDTANFSVSAFEVKFDNYTRTNRKFVVEKHIINANTISLKIYHDLKAKYTLADKPEAKDVSFSFNIDYEGEFLKKIITNKVAIKKVY